MSNSPRFLFVTTGLDPVVHAGVQLSRCSGNAQEPRRRMDRRGKPGNDDVRKKEIKEAERRQTYCRQCRIKRMRRAPRKGRLAPPFRYRARSPAGVPPRFCPREVGSLGAIRARLPGTWPVRLLRPPVPVPVQRCTSHTGPSAGRRDARTARERGANPPAGTALAPPLRYASGRASLAGEMIRGLMYQSTGQCQ